jgi:hypothetical protein
VCKLLGSRLGVALNLDLRQCLLFVGTDDQYCL